MATASVGRGVTRERVGGDALQAVRLLGVPVCVQGLFDHARAIMQKLSASAAFREYGASDYGPRSGWR